jgi:hypothetical protein
MSEKSLTFRQFILHFFEALPPLGYAQGAVFRWFYRKTIRRGRTIAAHRAAQPLKKSVLIFVDSKALVKTCLTADWSIPTFAKPAKLLPRSTLGQNIHAENVAHRHRKFRRFVQVRLRANDFQSRINIPKYAARSFSFSD